MEMIDPNMEQQVWQRVTGHSATEPRQEDFRSLMLAALEAAAVYRQLAAAFTGTARERVKRLYEGEMANIACLKGIRKLSGGGVGKLPALSAPKEPAEKALEKRYHHARRAMVEYMSRAADPEFGVVFEKIAQREREHCAVLAELIGGLGR